MNYSGKSEPLYNTNFRECRRIAGIYMGFVNNSQLKNMILKIIIGMPQHYNGVIIVTVLVVLVLVLVVLVLVYHYMT